MATEDAEDAKRDVDPTRISAAEDTGWRDLHALIAALTPEQAERPGYYPEGWSAKDLLAHVGAWLAEAGVMLERIAAGTYRREEVDVNEMNLLSLEAMRDVSFATVKAQASAARARMRRAWLALPESSPEAAFWIQKSGPEHYGQHLARLHEWVGEVDRGLLPAPEDEASSYIGGRRSSIGRSHPG